MFIVYAYVSSYQSYTYVLWPQFGHVWAPSCIERQDDMNKQEASRFFSPVTVLSC